MLRPNLEDYEEVCRTFTWEQAEEELGVKNSSRINLAALAVDQPCREGKGDRIALRFWDGVKECSFTFAELKGLSDRFALVLEKLGVEPGDRVALFGPPAPELYASFLGIIKRGAIAVPLFEGYMPEALAEFLREAEAKVLVTSAPGRLKFDWRSVPELKYILVVGLVEAREAGGVISWYRAVGEAVGEPKVVPLPKEAPFVLLFTSGSTGKPKGILLPHRAAVQYYQTGKWVLDLKENDVYWCTAGLSWVTGVAYGVLAPWLNRVTTVIYGGELEPENFYETFRRFGVTVWYTTPMILRTLMAAEKVLPPVSHRLRHILTVGEALNPALVRWSRTVFGVEVYDTWFMTETGGHMIANFRCLPVKAGSMGKPVPGVKVAVLDPQGKELGPYEIGQLALLPPWPAMFQGVWRDEARYQEYFRLAPWYLTGDLVYRDKEGYYWYQGRVDDLIKVGEKRVGPCEIESKLLEHPAVLEAGVIGKPDFWRGEIVKAFIVLRPGYQWSAKLQAELTRFIRTRLADYLVPQEFEVLPQLPRTPNGKLLRRVLKAWDMGLPCDDGTGRGEAWKSGR
ncbi:AMP-dependent synthetase and ligase [Ammonifex degensii KC4]|uniref:acetate--CoA ligase n=1 Tax=Ammonifex degensii (strain DSM 10501 / KC4) TaxID=429009 RepID=C9R9F9_AMMDK|nr:AMP-binding protein [Ammonifex degensii]ACX52938.1 AMP-dependent synthetase and ligase [Ammonifex degensii KC4]